MYVTRKALCFRREHRRALSQSRYTPLYASGPGAGHLCAFARRAASQVFIVAVPRLVAGLTNGEEPYGPREGVWDSTRLPIPAQSAPAFENVFTGEVIKATEADGVRALPAATLFSSFPVALLVSLEGDGETKGKKEGGE